MNLLAPICKLTITTLITVSALTALAQSFPAPETVGSCTYVTSRGDTARLETAPFMSCMNGQFSSGPVFNGEPAEIVKILFNDKIIFKRDTSKVLCSIRGLDSMESFSYLTMDPQNPHQSFQGYRDCVFTARAVELHNPALRLQVSVGSRKILSSTSSTVGKICYVEKFLHSPTAESGPSVAYKKDLATCLSYGKSVKKTLQESASGDAVAIMFGNEVVPLQ